MNKIIKNSYEIIKKSKSEYIVGGNLLEDLDKILNSRFKKNNYILITDQNLFNLYGRKIKRTQTLIIPEKENGKNLDILPSVLKKILEGNINRDSVIIALGGGAITDSAGFIASILYRGIKCVFIPTTLLSMIDAAIGGKNGLNVNIKGIPVKNMIGTFYQPDLVISDVDVLKTLPVDELKNGMGEIVKYYIAFGRPDINMEMLNLINECQKIKMDIVAKDPFDSLKIRETLNLGHTVGHAVESVAQGRYSHGEAVAIGIVAEAKISHEINLLSKSQLEKIISLIASVNLPVNAPGLSSQKLINTMGFDKKDGRFVLIKNIGKTVIKDRISKSIIKKVLSEITQ